jgi:hypothetical protein
MRALQFFNAGTRYRDVVLPALQAGLRDDDVDVRSSAAFGLLRSRTSLPEVAAAFARTFEQPELPGTNAHQETAMALEEMGRDAAPAAPALMRALRACTDPDLAVSLALALARTRDAAGRRLLVELRDEGSIVGDAARYALDKVM